MTLEDIFKTKTKQTNKKTMQQWICVQQSLLKKFANLLCFMLCHRFGRNKFRISIALILTFRFAPHTQNSPFFGIITSIGTLIFNSTRARRFLKIRLSYTVALPGDSNTENLHMHNCDSLIIFLVSTYF